MTHMVIYTAPFLRIAYHATPIWPWEDQVVVYTFFPEYFSLNTRNWEIPSLLGPHWIDYISTPMAERPS